MIQFQKKSALAQTIQDDKFGRIKDSVVKLSQVCRDSHEKEGKGRSGKGSKAKEDPNEQLRLNLIEELSQQVEHVELMHQETVKQQKLCKEKIAQNDKRLKNLLGRSKTKSKNPVPQRNESSLSKMGNIAKEEVQGYASSSDEEDTDIKDI